MPNKDQVSNLYFPAGYSPDRTTDNTPLVASVDTAGYEALTFVIQTGTLADADATFTVLIEDSPDNSVWTAVPDTFLIGTEAGINFEFGDDDENLKIGYNGKQRYCRCTVTPANNTGNVDLAILPILGFPHKGITSGNTDAD